tara:strand:+ start:5783 stop:7141 length:1359 start_codon:yes stop_codon:yes gene_type:complete
MILISMKSITLQVLLAIVVVTLATMSDGTQQVMNSVLIEDVNLITMVDETPVLNQDILVVGGIIKEIGDLNSKTYDIDLLIDGTNKFLIPGLSEMHYHWRNIERPIETEIGMMVVNGVTTIRNMGEYGWQDQIMIRDSLIRNMIYPISYLTTGPYLKANDLSSKAEIDSQLNQHTSMGYDYLKIADDLESELYAYLINEAEVQGLEVVGHIQRSLPLRKSLEQRSIDHVEEFIYLFSTEERNDSVFVNNSITEIKKSGVFINPTLAVFEMITQFLNNKKFDSLENHQHVAYMLKDDASYWLSDENEYRVKLKPLELEGNTAEVTIDKWFDWMKKYTNQLNEAGVPLLTGSDTFGLIVPGFSIHRELELLVESGLTPFEALLTSTVNAARFTNRLGSEGTIEVGKKANLVMLNNNPLDDISNTQDIVGVLVQTIWIDSTQIKKVIENVTAKEY